MPKYVEEKALKDEVVALRDKAINLVKQYSVLGEHEKWDKAVQARTTVCEIVELIEALPVTDAEPVRHGRWVNHISENGATDGTYCGICDYEVDRDARYYYCPNCGAKMDEED